MRTLPWQQIRDTKLGVVVLKQDAENLEMQKCSLLINGSTLSSSLVDFKHVWPPKLLITIYIKNNTQLSRTVLNLNLGIISC